MAETTLEMIDAWIAQMEAYRGCGPVGPTLCLFDLQA